jgi:peptidoglycan glycosyltransferase
VNRPLRRVAAFFALLLFALVANLTYVQVVKARDYQDRPGNIRQVLAEYDRERGPIIDGRNAVAQSVSTNDQLRYLRTYPKGPMYAPITGYYSLIYGATGLERAENAILSGNDDRLIVDRITQLLSGREPQGGTIEITINPRAQEAAYEGLRGKSGAVVAVDPGTGAILALASTPSFDPERLSSQDPEAISAAYAELSADPDEPLLNRPLSQTYAPGSTFKIITAAAAIASGDYTKDTVIPAPRRITLPNSTAPLNNFNNARCSPNGKMTLEDALRISCNTAFALLGIELGDDALREQAEAFGFNSDFTVPMTTAESVFPSDLDPAQTAQAAIGQFDVRATAIEMAMVSAAIADSGNLYEPYLVSKKLAPDLAVLDVTEPSVRGTAVSPEVAAQLRDMMTTVVQSGTGTAASISGIQVAGKSGTAQKGEGEAPDAWFTAFAPARDAQVAVSVIIEDGGGDLEATGGALSAPIARAVIEAVLNR